MLGRQEVAVCLLGRQEVAVGLLGRQEMTVRRSSLGSGFHFDFHALIGMYHSIAVFF